MPALSKKLMRSLPTLTEVVRQPSAAAQAPHAEEPAPLLSAAAQEELIERLLARLEEPLQARVQALVGELLQEQVQALQPRIRVKVDAAVRKAVTEALTGERLPARRTKS